MKVGFIGLGNMGGPMAANLLAANIDLNVFNRTTSKAEALVAKGAKIANSPAELSAECDLILACLSSVEASRALFLGDDGLLTNARPGQVFVDHATVDRESSVLCYEAAQKKDAHFLDAPISGGPGGATDATLSIMVGGDASAFKRAQPAFAAMGKTVVHMGAAGSGTATKLANQLLVGVQTAAICEALEMARQAGTDMEKLLSVLTNSWGASRMLDRNAPNIVAEDFGPSPVPIRNLHKDLTIIRSLGKELNLKLSVTEKAHAVFDEFVSTGRGEWDITAPCLKVRGIVDSGTSESKDG